MALIESGLRGFQQKARRGGREVRVLQLLFGRGIKSDGTQRLRASPAVSRRNWNRLIKRAKRWRRRNLFQKLCRIFLARTKFCESRRGRVPKIRLREPLDSLSVKTAR